MYSVDLDHWVDRHNILRKTYKRRIKDERSSPRVATKVNPKKKKISIVKNGTIKAISKRTKGRIRSMVK